MQLLSRAFWWTPSESQEKLRPLLPKGNVSWARSSRLLKPLPRHFPRVWIRRLKENPKPLTKAQQRKFRENVALLLQQPELSALFHSIIRSAVKTFRYITLVWLPFGRNMWCIQYPDYMNLYVRVFVCSPTNECSSSILLYCAAMYAIGPVLEADLPLLPSGEWFSSSVMITLRLAPSK